jgi:hypothetical protein
MRLEYENGLLRVENADGLRWQLSGAEKPKLAFQYDALHVSDGRALRRIGPSIYPLSESELKQVEACIKQLSPPPWATFQRQIIADLRAFAHGLINSVVAQLEYEGLLDVVVAGREGSTDIYAEEARRILAWVDTVWNALDGLAARIEETPKAELKSVNDYAKMMPISPPIEYFTGDVRQDPRVAGEPVKTVSAPAVSSPSRASVRTTASAVTVEAPAPATADLSSMVNRALVFDDLFSGAQLLLLQQWALQTPHWMLTNSARDEEGRAQHRIWGASYIHAWREAGWPGLPPVLFSAATTLFQKLGVTVTEPAYIGLNGQSSGQDGSIHVDCARDAADQVSVLVYIGEDTDGDLILYDKDDRERILHRIEFRPNRVVVFDGYIPHAASAVRSVPSMNREEKCMVHLGTVSNVEMHSQSARR